MSPYKIGDLFNCSFSTVTNRLKEHSIPFKNQSLARIKYAKNDFSGNKVEKAYMVGFRIGDLNVYKTSEDSEVVIARCHTTTQEQIRVIEEIFGKYGKITTSLSKRSSYHINCYLNKSFDFLLDKSFPFIPLESVDEIFAFIAGYFDAEGCLGLNQNRARVKIDSYDADVLHWINKRLSESGINNILKTISVCKTKRNQGKQLWRLNINNMDDVAKFIFNIEKYCKHFKKLSQIETAKKNIIMRKKERVIHEHKKLLHYKSC